MDDLSTIKDLVNLWPRRADLARDLSDLLPDAMDTVSVAQVHKWAQHGAIPARYHHAVLQAANARQIALSAEQLVRLHAPVKGAAA